jgi:hypothetical protein
MCGFHRQISIIPLGRTDGVHGLDQQALQGVLRVGIPGKNTLDSDGHSVAEKRRENVGLCSSLGSDRAGFRGDDTVDGGTGKMRDRRKPVSFSFSRTTAATQRCAEQTAFPRPIACTRVAR